MKFESVKQAKEVILDGHMQCQKAQKEFDFKKK